MQEKNLTTIYVSQAEKKAGCARSLEEALETVARLRQRGEEQPITVKIVDAVYYVRKPVVIGKDVSAVTIEPKTQTLLCGGMEVTDFREDVFHGAKCISADLSACGDLEFTDFYVGKKAAKLPRYPKEGTLSAETVEDPSTELHAHSGWFTAKKEDFETISGFSNLEDGFISFNHWWVDEHTPIRSIDRETRKFTLKYKTRFSVSMESESSALWYVIENVPEIFGEPNDWYYDKPTRKLYYIPIDTQIKAADAAGYIPVTDRMLCIRGTEDEKAHDITVRGFDIAYTKGDYASFSVTNGDRDDDVGEGYASDCQGVCDAHAGIEIENACACTVENCRLYCFGVHGIRIRSGAHNIRIIGNDMTDLGAGAVVVSGGEYGSDARTHTYGNVISDNRIQNCGRRYFSACGILLMHTYENTVSHNEIGYQYYTGISCGWVWGYGESIAHHNLIEKNHIHHLGLGKLSDMGGVYLLGEQRGTVVRGNLIHDIRSKTYGGWALYTDEGSRYALIENNICYNASESLYHQHFGAMNTIRNNIFAFGGEYAVMYTKNEPHTGIILEGNIIVVAAKPVFNTGFAPEEKDGKPDMIVSGRNLIFNTEGGAVIGLKNPEREYSLEELQAPMGMDDGSIVADPQFIDMENYDFRLKETSPAYQLGFRDIDLSDVGLTRWR